MRYVLIPTAHAERSLPSSLIHASTVATRSSCAVTSVQGVAGYSAPAQSQWFYLAVHGAHPYMFRAPERQILSLLAQYGVRIDEATCHGNYMHTRDEVQSDGYDVIGGEVHSLRNSQSGTRMVTE